MAASNDLSLDSRNPSIMNGKQTDLTEKIPTRNSSKYTSCNASSEEMTPLVDRKILEGKMSCKQMESNISATKTLSTIGKNAGNARSSHGDNNITKHSDFPEASASAKTSKKSAGTQTDKTHKRVHFKSEVETYTFETSLSIRENYNYTEEFSLENVVSDVFNERRFLTAGVNNVYWDNESDIDVNSRECPIREDWLKSDRHFHYLSKDHLPIPVYSKLKDEDSSGVSKTSVLKRSGSCFFRKNKKESENESRYFSRRLSMSMHSLKFETKSLFDKFVTKVTKKKMENVPTRKSLRIDVGDLAGFSHKELNGGPKLRKTGGLSRSENWEVGCQNAVSGNLTFRPWISVQNPRLKRTFSLPDLSSINTEDIIDDHEKEVKGGGKFAKRGGLFQKKKSKDKSDGIITPRAWKSTKHLNSDSKSLMDKFIMKVAKK